MYNRVSF